MKKTLLITFGTLLFLIIVGVLIYLIMFGVPKNNDEVFSNFGLGGPSPEFTGETSSTDDTPTDTADKPKALRQLTTRPVAGAVFIDETVRYVERGTGYVYDIDLTSGEETLVSGTTIPKAVTAVFSSLGNRVAITTEKNGSNEIIVGTFTKDDTGGASLDGMTLPAGARDVLFNEKGDSVYYHLKTTAGSSGHLHNLNTGKSSILFEIPLRDVEVLWGDPLYVYTTPSAKQSGYVYRVNKSDLEYVTEKASGIMIVRSDGEMVKTIKQDSGATSATLSDDPYELPITLFPEKCTPVPSQKKSLYCAAPNKTLTEGTYPDDWYSGKSSFIDSLWFVNLDEKFVQVLSNLLTESGREIDVEAIGTNPDGDYLYFINKNDGTLWMFDTTVQD